MCICVLVIHASRSGFVNGLKGKTLFNWLEIRGVTVWYQSYGMLCWSEGDLRFSVSEVTDGGVFS